MTSANHLMLPKAVVLGRAHSYYSMARAMRRWLSESAKEYRSAVLFPNV